MIENDIKKITILMIDDDRELLKRNKKDIISYYSDENINVNWLDDDGKNFDELINSTKVDILLLDNNLLPNDLSTNILKKAANGYDYLDIMLYSVAPDNSMDIKEKIYGRLEIRKEKIERRHIVEMVEWSMKKWNDVVYVRGTILSKMVDLENEMDKVLSQYFNIHINHMDDFDQKILKNSKITLYGKQKLLQEMLCDSHLEEFKIINKIECLRNFRNIVAHSIIQNNKTILVAVSGKQTDISRKDLMDNLELTEKIIRALKNMHDKIHEFRNKQK